MVQLTTITLIINYKNSIKKYEKAFTKNSFGFIIRFKCLCRKHKNLKKKVTIAEEKRNLRRGQKSWKDLRVLKKLKLNMKDKLFKK